MGIYFIGFFLAHPTENSSKQFTLEKSQEESSNICKIEDKTPIVIPGLIKNPSFMPWSGCVKPIKP